MTDRQVIDLAYEFDAAWYLQRYADVRAAIEAGRIASPVAHYHAHGRSEGRLPCREAEAAAAAGPDDGADAAPTPLDAAYAFDETWYRARFPDVQEAIADGRTASALAHYRRHGQAEGRLPCAAAEHDQRLARGVFAADGAVIDAALRRGRVEDAWSSTGAETGWYWMAHPMVRARVNRLTSGDPGIDSYGHLAAVMQRRGLPVPIPRAISLGCGFGDLERLLAARALVHEIEAYDIAPGAIDAARRLAEAAGHRNIRYSVRDLDHDGLEAQDVDVIFAHQSVHHIEQLEALFASVARALRPGGLFHLHEFVGPVRFQWTDAQIDAVNEFLESLPPRLRALPSGAPKPLQGRASIAAMVAADPSEAVRSADILPVLRDHFEVIELRNLGGTLLHLGLGGIAQNFDPAAHYDRCALEAFFAAEDQALADGTITSDFVDVIALKRD